jgi:hypothetical protein
MPRKQKSLLFAVLAALLLPATLAGCGGDTRRGEAESTAAATAGETGTTLREPASQGGQRAPVLAAKVTDPVRRAYVGRVDAVCGHIDPERSAERKRVRTASGTAGEVRAYDDTISLGWKELRQIEAIPAPPGDRALLRANVFDPIRRQLSLRGRIGRALGALDVPRLRILRGEMDNLTRALSGFARGYGFRICGGD